ncbi:MAG TPA: CmcJ/NvfI family oxidoreductase [Steroidobacteraceae bacterium]|nr:CmcJ/NvfI family oxidoreductase [Steroidobacteraceae bacterium]
MRLSGAALGSSLQVDGRVSYVVASKERPRNYADDPPPGVEQSTAQYEDRTVTVRNLRPYADVFSIDREGFQFASRASGFRDFDDAAAIREKYYAESANVVAELTGASRVLVFDHTLRGRTTGGSRGSATTTRPPVHRVHVDFTAASGPRRARDVLGEGADALEGRRYSVINLWRPIRGPLEDSPLAVTDARSVAFDDLVATDLIYPDRVGEFYTVRFNSAHRWYYAPCMAPDEVLLLKCFDSSESGIARFAPHTAFADPDAPADALPRESIEVRTLAFFDA